MPELHQVGVDSRNHYAHKTPRFSRATICFFVLENGKRFILVSLFMFFSLMRIVIDMVVLK